MFTVLNLPLVLLARNNTNLNEPYYERENIQPARNVFKAFFKIWAKPNFVLTVFIVAILASLNEGYDANIYYYAIYFFFSVTQANNYIMISSGVGVIVTVIMGFVIQYTHKYKLLFGILAIGNVVQNLLNIWIFKAV